jgi:hypothetical protein
MTEELFCEDILGGRCEHSATGNVIEVGDAALYPPVRPRQFDEGPVQSDTA